MTGGDLGGSAARLLAVLDEFDLEYVVREFPASARTAAEAAAAIGCGVGQIAKSLIFRGAVSGRPVLVIASGANRVDLEKAGALVGERLAKADADFVRAATGFAIGGVPPVGHVTPPATLIDADLAGHDTIWAAAGTPHAVFRLTPDDLRRITAAAFADVKMANTKGS